MITSPLDPPPDCWNVRAVMLFVVFVMFVHSSSLSQRACVKCTVGKLWARSGATWAWWLVVNILGDWESLTFTYHHQCWGLCSGQIFVRSSSWLTGGLRYDLTDKDDQAPDYRLLTDIHWLLRSRPWLVTLPSGVKINYQRWRLVCWVSSVQVERKREEEREREREGDSSITSRVLSIFTSTLSETSRQSQISFDSRRYSWWGLSLSLDLSPSQPLLVQWRYFKRKI